MEYFLKKTFDHKKAPDCRRRIHSPILPHLGRRGLSFFLSPPRVFHDMDLLPSGLLLAVEF